MLLSRKSIIKDTAQKAIEISMKMEYCFPEHNEDLDINCINLFTILYYHELQHRPADPQFEGRDRLITTKGSELSNLFAVLAEVEYFGWNTAPQLMRYVKESEHSLLTDIPGIHAITKTHELAMSLANGLALRAKTVNAEYKVYVVFPSVNDPVFYETLYATSEYQLNNVIAIVKAPQGHYRGNIIHNWFALGWHIEEVDFAAMDTIHTGFSRASRIREKPTVLIG